MSRVRLERTWVIISMNRLLDQLDLYMNFMMDRYIMSLGMYEPWSWLNDDIIEFISMIIVEEAMARGRLLSPTILELKYMIMVNRMKLIVR
jgi:hypothetical protein